MRCGGCFHNLVLLDTGSRGSRSEIVCTQLQRSANPQSLNLSDGDQNIFWILFA